MVTITTGPMPVADPSVGGSAVAVSAVISSASVVITPEIVLAVVPSIGSVVLVTRELVAGAAATSENKKGMTMSTKLHLCVSNSHMVSCLTRK